MDGVEPYRGDDGVDYYTGEQLAGRPVVAEAVARLPYQEPYLVELPLYLSVSTADGRKWTFAVDESVRCLFDLSYGGSDIVEEHLSAQPWITAVERVDRDVFECTVSEDLTADVVLARCIDICGEVYRRLDP
ncbi:hypothetical protein MB27_26450 [Actinoplanes utahensis]|uniref:Uncharacterized protein n=1 Tax=Actinoplanes utahensis TaxID=1869 RepID=A0A0A6UHG2_ACTUT|nr:hypothetical protein MB27_26450 [Actinoplanes utahensis]